jgi:uncharacterized protein (TIGR00255 family)
MTGFARFNGNISLDENNISWIWEVKSVNGKSLDLKYRLPNGFEDISLNLKNKASEVISRGSVSAFLEINNETSAKNLKIDENLLNKLAEQALVLCQKHPSIPMATAGELLSQRGVVEIEENTLNEDNLQKLKDAVLADFLITCKNLQEDRKKEGEKIKTALISILEKISDITTNIEKIFETLPEKLKEKLLTQIKCISEDVNISEERLAQEIVLLVTRADIKEEIDRLKTHIKSAYNLLDSNEAIGRRLDFLCQELNREANTTCSKASDVAITNLGMELKALIEQFREQVQNIE